ncbi:hypothetical protein NIE88_02895 [Sporolactobacillus shoreicorticis]|uniref:Uncharacterized protein n=1 Tax=Sporolactobacillus shoreicorticis TaxID=1923877 RepID=A0ABW5S263_9BACL|nr:hypothetical protein [Sporolactobacillus shoreicorticis]MCO7124724.1 hypothetical protein [Sporolactobacillus shoreicorticis]
MDEKFVLDPNKFAESVIRSQTVAGNNEEEIVKNKLKLYLTAYVIAGKFNKLENRAFYNKETHKEDYGKVLKNIKDLGIY